MCKVCKMHVFSALTFVLVVACGASAVMLPKALRGAALLAAGAGGGARLRSPTPLTWMARDRRVPHRLIHPVDDCFLVSADEGELFYKAATDEGAVCGVYLIAPPDKRIELRFNYLDVPCENGGLVAWVDGWELNQQVWPAEAWSDERVTESCGHRPSRAYISQQNAALLQYRVPARGRGFSVRVRHLHNARPCNIMLYGSSGVHTLRNHGSARNCSVVAMGPAAVQVLAIDVGRSTKRPATLDVETGMLRQCAKRGFSDHVDVGGASGLDTTNMEVLESVCGLDSNEDRRPALIGCANTVVRLVSGGRYHNAVTVAFEPLDEQDLMRADLFCQI